mgnify:CR=1 FL=1
MDAANKLKVLFIVNPISGGVAKDNWEDRIRAFFNDKPFEVLFSWLRGQNDSECIRRELDYHQPDRVVAVGGDGTVKLVAQQLNHTITPLGIIPAGSANGMARELGLPATLEEALDVVAEGREKPIDVLLVNGKDICLHLSDIGMNAQLVKYFEKSNLRGKLGYARGALRVLLRRRRMRVEIRTGDTVLRRVAVMVVIANARMYGTGAVINPDGDVSDGMFEVVVMRRFTLWEVIKMFWRYRPFNPKNVEILRASAIRIETRRRAYFQIDGEYRGRVKTIEAEIRPGGLRVLLPS